MKTREPSAAPDWLRVEAAVEAFERAYAAAGTADPADYCPPPADPLHRPVAAELVRADLEFAAAAGRPKRLDAYRRHFPALFADPKALTPVAFEEFRLRKQAGEAVTPDEYERRYGVNTAGWAAAGRPKSNPSFALPGGLTDVFADLPAEAKKEAAAVGLAASQFPEPGAEVAGFRLVGELGTGAFARVYLAEQADLAGRFVALKLSTKLVAEAQTLARLQHTNIVPVYSVHRAGPFHAVCMPFLGSVTLADVLRRLRDQGEMPVSATGLFSTLEDKKDGSTLPPAAGPTVGLPAPPPDPAGLLAGLRRKSHVEAVLWIGAELADGLAHAHDRGIVHRDLKPANVLLADDGRPMLLDFNLSGDARQPDPLAGAVGGTPGYMAPEQLDALTGRPAKVDARSDLYALGLILHQLLTGRAAHPLPDDPLAGTLDRLRAARTKPPTPATTHNPAVTPAVDAILAKCLAPTPADRYPSARHLREDLLRQLENLPLRHVREPSWRERAGKFVRRNPWTRSAAFLGGLLVIVLGGGAALVTSVAAQRDAAARTVADRKFRDEAAGLRLALAAGDDHRRVQTVAAAKQTLARFGLPGGDGADTEYPLAGRESAEAKTAATDLYLMLASAELTRADADRAAGWLDAAGRYDPARADRLRGWLKQPTGPTGDDDLDVLLTAHRRNNLRRILGVLDARPPATLQTHHWVAKAECHTALGQFADAAACYTTALALTGRPNPDLTAARGRALLEAGRPAAAVADFDAALAQTPDAAGARLNRALALLKLGKPAEAVVELDRVVELWPSHTRARFVRAEAKAKAGDKAGAAADRKLALEAEPGDETSWVSRGIAKLNAGDAAGALADFDAVLVRNPQSRDARQNKAAVLGDHQNRTADAVTVLDGLIADWPEYVPARAGRGVYLARLGQREAAHADARAVLAADPPPFFRYQVAGIYALTSKTHPADAAEALRLLAAAFQDRAGLEYVANDPDLAPLRKDAQFRQLVQAAQELARVARGKP